MVTGAEFFVWPLYILVAMLTFAALLWGERPEGRVEWLALIGAATLWPAFWVWMFWNMWER